MFESYFSPLDKGSCVYFLITTAIFFVLLIIILVSEIFFAISNYDKLNFKIPSKLHGEPQVHLSVVNSLLIVSAQLKLVVELE